MYVCGPTVYDRAHLGNARPVIVFDVLNRLLRHVYGDDHVTYVRNFTDVDDKINARAAESGRSIGEITAETTQWYLDDMAAVGAMEPDYMPRATAYIAQMIAVIEDLIAKGHAYEAEGHALFRVRSYKDYGALSGRSVDDMIAGARIEVAPYKEDPMDFVLWKPSAPDQPGWDSPWGRGRPGWHSEFDIHGGGNDLTFPHHENEIAQSTCAGHGFANYWMHNEMLQVEGKKMSKSLGNFFTVRDLLDQGVPGEVIRFVMLSTHYRKPMDWTEKKRIEAEKTLRDWAYLALNAQISGENDFEVVGALSDDLNTSDAISLLNEMYRQDDADDLLTNARLLGFDLKAIAEKPWARLFEFVAPSGDILHEGTDYQPIVGVVGWGEIGDELRDEALKLVRRWLNLRRQKDWSKADQLKSDALEVGVELRASRSENGVNNGTASLKQSDIDPIKLERMQ
ncbi:UNVERIFIED_CONTAM: hypothetical protein GTU68_033825 [Idotea baltica]|nr:hypothetical protein [Idotea baltica]